MRSSLVTLDWIVIGLYVAFAFSVGAFYTRRASAGVSSFFVGDRKFSWWMAGTSILATTFAADTPLAVTGIVADGGISGNWIWWSWGIAHLTATFFFARLWRRSGVITDAEVTELRYGGRAAAVLRGFKAIYWGLFINCLTMAWVISAMVKISQALFDVRPVVVIVVCITVSVGYTTLGGFRSVVVTDMVQFCLGMTGAVILAYLAVSSFGGMGAVPGAGGEGSGLLGALARASAEAGRPLNDLLALAPPPGHPKMSPVYFIVLLLAGWWRLAEGNGYMVQRLASCKDEGHAQGASLWFAVMHNALRPWPWILVGLAALIIFPGDTLADREMAYPLLMVKLLPAGLLGLVVASLLAAFMSTIDTHTNWGASYLVQDMYRRFIRPDADERRCVTVSRLCILLMACLAGVTALFVQSIAAVWSFMNALGAGLGSVSAARWYWSRVTPVAELAAMAVTTVASITLQVITAPTLAGWANPLYAGEVHAWTQIVIVAAVSLVTWIPVSLWGPPNAPETLARFMEKVRPPGPGWASVRTQAVEPMTPMVLRFAAGLVIVYGALFGMGHVILGSAMWGWGLLVLAGLLLAWIVRGEVR